MSALKAKIVEHFPTKINELEVVSLGLICSSDVNGAYSHDANVEYLRGKDHIIQTLRGYKFKVSPLSFFQINTHVFT